MTLDRYNDSGRLEIFEEAPHAVNTPPVQFLRIFAEHRYKPRPVRRTILGLGSVRAPNK